MIAIFDLDYTLLDSDSLKVRLAEALGLAEDEYRRQYKEYFKDKGLNYSIAEHLKIIKKEDDPGIRRNLEIFFENLGSLAFKDAESILREFRDGGYDMVMVSFGNELWQKMKLDNLPEIKKYFDDKNIIFTGSDKAEALRQLAYLFPEKEEKVLINDNAKEGLEMREALKNSRLYLVDNYGGNDKVAGYARNAEHDERIYSLKELKELLFSSEPSKELRLNFSIK